MTILRWIVLIGTLYFFNKLPIEDQSLMEIGLFVTAILTVLYFFLLYREERQRKKTWKDIGGVGILGVYYIVMIFFSDHSLLELTSFVIIYASLLTYVLEFVKSRLGKKSGVPPR